jgi:hypothetical protein
MKLKTAVKRLEQDFGMVGVEYRVKTWEMYQPVEFWILTEKYYINVMPTGQVSTRWGYLSPVEFDKHEVNYLATDRRSIKISVSKRGDYTSKDRVFKFSSKEQFDQILESLEG